MPSVLTSARGENCQVLSLLGLLFLPLPRESNDQVGFGWSISYKIAWPFRPAILASMIFFFSSVCQNGALIFFLGKREKEGKERKEGASSTCIKNLEFSIVMFNRESKTYKNVNVESCEARKKR